MVGKWSTSRGVRKGGSDVIYLLFKEVGEIIREKGGGGRGGWRLNYQSKVASRH